MPHPSPTSPRTSHAATSLSARLRPRGGRRPRVTLRMLAVAVALAMSLLGFTAGFVPAAQAAPAASTDSVVQRSTLNRIKALLPADVTAKVAELRRQADVIDPTQYECGPTSLNAWVEQRVARWSTTDRLLVQLIGLDAYPTLDVTLFGHVNDSFYEPRVQADQVRDAFTRSGAFWESASDDTILLGMHSDMTRSPAKVARIGAAVFGLGDDEAHLFGTLVAGYVRLSPGFERGRTPLFSFNAYAQPGLDETSPAMVVMGDGMLQAYDALGYGDVAGAFITAHEVGHTVQMRAGLFDDHSGEPEETRYTELMADAMSAYALAHPRGLGLDERRVDHFVAVAYAIGDCAFDAGGHHGTPNQRARAAQWAAAVSDAASPAGRVLTFGEFKSAFDAAYPNLIAPDATT